MEKTLISMVDFVLQKITENNLELASLTIKWQSDANRLQVERYATFLKQPLKLGMFVPCDENDVPLEEPLFDEVDLPYGTQYQQAKERVLFEGFEIDYDKIVKNGDIRIWFRKGVVYLNNTKNELKTIEDLVKYNLKLTKKPFD